MKKLKIIYYSAHPNLNLSSPSGYGTHMREMIRAMEELGHEVFPVIAGGVTPSAAGAKNNPPVRKALIRKLVPSILWQSLKDFRLLKFDRYMQQKLEQAIADFKPDFVFERLNYLQLSGVRACKKAGVCHFFEINSPYLDQKLELEGDTLFKRKAIKHERVQITETNKAFVVTTSLANYFKETHQLVNGSAAITILPNAIDPVVFKANRDRVKEVRKNLKLKEGELIIGFVGSILKWHGVDLLIKSFREVAQKNERCRLLVVGGGESLPELKELVKQLQIDERVIFMGDVAHSDIPNYIELMDITVLPNTNWYGSPIKLFEYGALQKAIVAPAYSSVTDVMDPGLDGILIEPSVEALADSILTLLDDDVLRNQLAERFHRKIMQKHTWKQNATVVLEAFENYQEKQAKS